MSTCNSGSTVCSPCGFNGVPDAANESLESALNNFIVSFYGSLTKTVVDGAVVWTLPCDLETGIEGYPRVEGEGLACYFLRVFGDIGGGAGVLPSREINTDMSLTGGGDLSANRTLTLVNDAASPGNNKFYGTNGSGTKGWHAVQVLNTLTIATTKSLTGGGDLSANRTLELVGDAASPGNSKYYGTDGAGTKGFYSLPATVGTGVIFGTTVATTVSDATDPETTLLGTVRAGESKTITGGTIASGDILEFRARGLFTSADSDWSNSIMRFKIGALVVTFTLAEADSYTPTNYLWDLSVYVTVTTSGASAVTITTGRLDFEYRDAGGVGKIMYYMDGVVTGTLDTTGANTVDLTWDNALPGGEMTVSCRHALLKKV